MGAPRGMGSSEKISAGKNPGEQERGGLQQKQPVLKGVLLGASS